MFPVKSIVEDGKLYCPCGYRFDIDLISGSGIRIRSKKDQTEIDITFDQIQAKCPGCKQDNEFESSLLDDILKRQDKIMARLNADKLDYFDFRFSNIPRLTQREKLKFLETLSENQRKIYKIMTDDSNKNLAMVYAEFIRTWRLDKFECQIQFLILASMAYKFKALSRLKHLKKELGVQEIKNIYADTEKYTKLLDEEEKFIHERNDKHEIMAQKVQKQLDLLPLSAWDKRIEELKALKRSDQK
ncbi:MAG: hypothetical protein A3G02_02195 [Candidatus Yanofskybacteria bacterium RIFCSPLOWO2_12_FULL_44_13b]|uniref:CpXC domain-containing protein n=1 Tax=Candidatus Yanofskybacteria bacterium RIFCSPLOWO2_02_FULL_44_18 TaxID=1802705 RepID=A0A1F8H1N0_9BACT|nr:MAG: hypothetical protein UW14_C0003G0021 [Candidatus Yanofskybacteria bacterium GW2011_GWA2_44_10]OGN14381.1 MAG: hypothetical protein A3C01_02860 [Candidatus Yanofskybacteria bacterium RIFCSPHIGHO2_02_FULL_44_36b]OGN18987.1 MAG: hypothetical protein A3F50_00020 [Candidatus Yanofskybacteria bacterium RIFCSPHIGHO2_12_FULL_44_29b]OGN26497.1 MAG: hypothetical protein A3B12_03135 [Candidatus Yanofskybacteria bacterium RIFCSPLOWO2_01_FULL_44_88]OGN31441.1 MAG: hypothetical protein A3I96_01240 [C